MVGLSVTPSKLKGKQLALSSEELEAEYSLSLKEILIKLERIYTHTQIRIGAIAPTDYNLLAKEIEANDEQCAIVESCCRTRM